MLASKMSAAEVSRELRLDGIVVHPTAISKWADRYSGMMCKYAGLLRVDAGYRWHVDELYFKIRGQSRYLFAVMDGASRFILSHDISALKKGVDPTRLFATAAARSLRLPRILVSDGLQEFCNAATKIFYRAAGSGLYTCGRYICKTGSTTTTCTSASTVSCATGYSARGA